MPAPRDVSQLRFFLGLINFYGNFVKDLHNLRAPLDALTKKDVVYTWTPECQSSFDKIKAILSSDLLFTHFDPSLPIIAAADASNYGMGATLSNRFADGCEKDFGQVDALSRLILSESSIPEEYVIAPIDADVTSEFSENCRHLPVSAESIRIDTQADRLIQLVINYTKSGNWPKVNCHFPPWHYYNRSNTMTTVKECLLTASRIVIPKSLQHRVLSAVHKPHPGQTRMKMLARSFVYWPPVGSDIEKLVKTCPRCASVTKDSIKAELHSWPKPHLPWTGVHADFAALMEELYYLLIVDGYSKG
ncbi:hypothetical protein RB195_023605 [Necator americanus]|uniref:RNA-directed DNA polymerase n=1 Tax=Necator americanus TaxID=51031 RepID=A0ABR1EM83_NECAM